MTGFVGYTTKDVIVKEECQTCGHTVTTPPRHKRIEIKGVESSGRNDETSDEDAILEEEQLAEDLDGLSNYLNAKKSIVYLDDEGPGSGGSATPSERLPGHKLSLNRYLRC